MARGGELDVAQKRLKNTVAQKKTRERKKLHGKWQRGLTSKAQLLVRQSLDLQWLTREEDAQGTLAAVREKVLPALNDLRKHLLNEPQPKRRVNVKDDDETEPPPPPPTTKPGRAPYSRCYDRGSWEMLLLQTAAVFTLHFARTLS